MGQVKRIGVSIIFKVYIKEKIYLCEILLDSS